MSILALGLSAAGTAIGGPAGGAAGAAAGSKLPGILTNLFGGAGRDAQRQARCDWFTEQALNGSPTAFRVLLGGVVNTASHESPMYTAAIATVTHQRPDVANQAYNLGGALWDNTDNDSSDKMRALVNNELATLSLTASNPGQPTSSGATPLVHTLPLMTTTASALPARKSPLIWIGAGVALLVVVFLVARGRK